MVSNNELKSCSSREVRSQRGGGFFTKSTELSALDMQLKLEENDIPMKSSTREVIEDDKNSEGDRHNTLDTGGIISASIAAEKHESNVDVEDEDETNRITPPFPWLPMTALCMGMLAHSVVFTNPLPFVAFMVVDFGMAENVDSAGYYAGWITGTFMIGDRTLELNMLHKSAIRASFFFIFHLYYMAQVTMSENIPSTIMLNLDHPIA